MIIYWVSYVIEIIGEISFTSRHDECIRRIVVLHPPTDPSPRSLEIRVDNILALRADLRILHEEAIHPTGSEGTRVEIPKGGIVSFRLQALDPNYFACPLDPVCPLSSPINLHVRSTRRE